METEKVEAAEVLDDYPEDEGLDRPRSRITAGPIIAIVIVVIIVSVVLLYTLSDPEVEDITILKPEFLTRGSDERYGISVEIHVMGGVKSVEGTGSLDVLFNGKNEYSQQVDIKSDMGSASIEFKDFVVANGNYTIVFSMDGRSEEIYFLAKMVPEDLNITLQYGNPFSDDPDAIMLVASPIFNYPDGQGESIYYSSPNYALKTTIRKPDGEVEEITRSMLDWNGQNRTLTKVWQEVDGLEMGYYTLSAEFTNNLVKPSSPYRTLESDPVQLTTFINRAPEITEIDPPSRIRQDTEVIFTFKAEDPDTNGRITYYSIDWGEAEQGDDNSVLEFIEIAEGESTTIRVSHQWGDPGTYTVSVTCADNGPEDDENPENQPLILF